MTAGMTAEALQRFLDAEAPERGPTVTAVTPLLGGCSRDTAIAEVVWGDGVMQRLVLRGDPPSDRGVFVSDRDEEWRVLRALASWGRRHRPLRAGRKNLRRSPGDRGLLRADRAAAGGRAPARRPADPRGAGHGRMEPHRALTREVRTAVRHNDIVYRILGDPQASDG